MTDPIPAVSIPPVLQQLPLTLSIRVGTVQTTVGELLAFEEGQLVTLARHIDEPLEICIDGRVVATGELIEAPNGDGIAVKILALVAEENAP